MGIGIGVLILILFGLVIGVILASSNPDTAMLLQLGGLPHNNAATPRNFRLWTVYPDGKVRFQSAYFPGANSAPASNALTIAGPLVNQPTDIQSVTYFGALNIFGALQNGPGGDVSRVYQLFSLEPDPASESYGINVLISNPPYVSVDKTDGSYRQMAMGAPVQSYYKQMIWALALPPGASVSSAVYKDENDSTSVMLRPYRQLPMDGWTLYYYDVSSLDTLRTIRIRYLPPTSGATVADPDFWKADRLR